MEVKRCNLSFVPGSLRAEHNGSAVDLISAHPWDTCTQCWWACCSCSGRSTYPQTLPPTHPHKHSLHLSSPPLPPPHTHTLIPNRLASPTPSHRQLTHLIRIPALSPPLIKDNIYCKLECSAAPYLIYDNRRSFEFSQPIQQPPTQHLIPKLMGKHYKETMTFTDRQHLLAVQHNQTIPATST